MRQLSRPPLVISRIILCTKQSKCRCHTVIGLGHGTVVCAVFLSVFLLTHNINSSRASVIQATIGYIQIHIEYQTIQVLGVIMVHHIINLSLLGGELSWTPLVIYTHILYQASQLLVLNWLIIILIDHHMGVSYPDHPRLYTLSYRVPGNPTAGVT